MNMDILDCIVNTYDDMFDDTNESYTVTVLNGGDNGNQNKENEI